MFRKLLGWAVIVVCTINLTMITMSWTWPECRPTRGCFEVNEQPSWLQIWGVGAGFLFSIFVGIQLIRTSRSPRE